MNENENENENGKKVVTDPAEVDAWRLDYLIIPRLKTSFGSFKAIIGYSQDLRDKSPEASGFSDIPISFSLKANKWNWSAPYILTLTPYTSVILPVSESTIKKDQLQTAISAGLSFGIIPDGIAPQNDGAWSLAIGVSLGQYIHAYSTDINGKILNIYSSNQSINLGYSYQNFNVTVEYINKSRMSYEGNTKNSFEHTEEIGYSINEYTSIGLGHTNAGSALKSNASDSNYSLVNENDSTVYISMGLAF